MPGLRAAAGGPAETVEVTEGQVDYHEMKEMSFEEKAQRAWDYQEIQNVMSAHSYYYEAQQQWAELDAIWSKREDIAYVPYSVGRQAVRDFYGAGNEWSRKEKLKIMNRLFPDVANIRENEGIGDMVIRLLSTPYIVIAGDGATAKGIWYSPSICTEIGQDGEPVPTLIWEKVEADFVKEDGSWKIWHLRPWPQFATPIDKSYIDGSRRSPGRTVVKKEPPRDEPPPEMAGPVGYHVKRVAKFEPELPRSYDTWEDSLSCV
jgi:hypothetical protein